MDVLGTASVEQAAGALSRAFASVEVEGDAHIVAALTAPVLASIGRALVRHGESLHLIAMGDDGRVTLRPAGRVGHHGRTGPGDVAGTGDPGGSVGVCRGSAAVGRVPVSRMGCGPGAAVDGLGADGVRWRIRQTRGRG